MKRHRPDPPSREVDFVQQANGRAFQPSISTIFRTGRLLAPSMRAARVAARL
jgi:hypothetical protein